MDSVFDCFQTSVQSGVMQILLTMLMLSLAECQTTTLSLLDSICASVNCPNGHCYIVGSQPMCACDVVFKAPNCEVVDLNGVNFIIIGSMVIAKWAQPPRLTDYAFVYYRITDEKAYIHKRTIDISDYESSVLVGNLRDGISMYRICIEPETIAKEAVLSQSMDHVTNCVNISTQPDYHTVFAWLIAACSCVAAVLLIYWQRDKIELLYFNRAITINNGIYNYNVAELIRLEKVRKDREKEYNLIQRIEEGRMNKMPLETIQDEQ